MKLSGIYPIPIVLSSIVEITYKILRKDTQKTIIYTTTTKSYLQRETKTALVLEEPKKAVMRLIS